ncbi:hypothetical protein H113_05544, partial [Trichophyton rubrum MR1459]
GGQGGSSACWRHLVASDISVCRRICHAGPRADRAGHQGDPQAGRQHRDTRLREFSLFFLSIFGLHFHDLVSRSALSTPSYPCPSNQDAPEYENDPVWIEETFLLARAILSTSARSASSVMIITCFD